MIVIGLRYKKNPFQGMTKSTNKRIKSSAKYMYVKLQNDFVLFKTFVFECFVILTNNPKLHKYTITFKAETGA